MVNSENTCDIHKYAYTHVGRIHKKNGPWIWKRERKDIWEGLEGERVGGDYVIIL